MSDLFYLTDSQLKRLRPCFPRSRGVPRVDDLRVISGIIDVLRRGLQWRDAPKEYGPHKTLYNRFIRWSERGGFDKIFTALAARHDVPDQLQIDATHLKAHRTAASTLLGDKGYDADWFRQALADQGITPCIPPKNNRKNPATYDKTLYKQRHKVENMFGRLNDLDTKWIATWIDLTPITQPPFM